MKFGQSKNDALSLLPIILRVSCPDGLIERKYELYDGCFFAHILKYPNKRIDLTKE